MVTPTAPALGNARAPLIQTLPRLARVRHAAHGRTSFLTALTAPLLMAAPAWRTHTFFDVLPEDCRHKVADNDVGNVPGDMYLCVACGLENNPRKPTLFLTRQAAAALSISSG